MQTSVWRACASALVACTVASVGARSAYADPPPPQIPPTPSTASAPPPPPTERASRDAATATSGLSSVPAPTPAEIRYRRVQVDVESNRPNAVVERRVSQQEENGWFILLPWHSARSTWEQVCVAPCAGADLDRYSTYRVAGANGISGSLSFTLPQGSDSLHLRVDAGNRYANKTGVVLSGVGLAALIVGGALLVDASNIKDHNDDVHTRNAGYVTGGVGIVALAIGIPLAILTRTSVYAGEVPLRAAAAPRFTGNGFTF
jgi:hypothetical protein